MAEKPKMMDEKKESLNDLAGEDWQIRFCVKIQATKSILLNRKESFNDLGKADKKGSVLKFKPFKSILMNRKRIPEKAMKMSSGPESKEFSLFSK